MFYKPTTSSIYINNEYIFLRTFDLQIALLCTVMVNQGVKEGPLLLNGITLPAPSALSSTSRMEASMNLNTFSISLTNFNLRFTKELFTSSIGHLHFGIEYGDFRQPSSPSTTLATILLGEKLSTYEDAIKPNLSSGTSKSLSGVDLRIAGHLEHCVQLSNLSPVSNRKTLAAFASMYVSADVKQTTTLNINECNGVGYEVQGVLHVAGVQYKSAEKVRTAMQEPSPKATTNLEYTISWQAQHNVSLLNGTKIQAHEASEISAGQFRKQEFTSPALIGATPLLDYPQTLALLQSSCALYPQKSIIDIKSASSRAASTKTPVPGRNSRSAGIIAAALRCVVNERSELRGSALFSAGYESTRSFTNTSASSDAFGIEIDGGVELAPRLLPAVRLKPTLAPPIAKTWAISGGNGALGQLSSDWLSQQGTSHQILLCRSGRINANFALYGLFDSISRGMITIQQYVNLLISI